MVGAKAQSFWMSFTKVSFVRFSFFFFKVSDCGANSSGIQLMFMSDTEHYGMKQ